MANTVLKANNISIVFGGLKAVDNFCIEIKEGELVGLIGPNGAGKTTVFNMLTGVYVPTSGTVELRGQDVTKMSPHNRVKIGIANDKKMDTKDYVLGKFSQEEVKILKDDYEQLSDIVDDFCSLSFDRLMSKYNHK